MHFFQLWVNLPSANKSDAPHFQVPAPKRAGTPPVYARRLWKGRMFSRSTENGPAFPHFHNRLAYTGGVLALFLPPPISVLPHCPLSRHALCLLIRAPPPRLSCLNCPLCVATASHCGRMCFLFMKHGLSYTSMALITSDCDLIKRTQPPRSFLFLFFVRLVVLLVLVLPLGLVLGLQTPQTSQTSQTLRTP